MLPLIIVGAGGFGLEVAAYVSDICKSGTGLFETKGFLDDSKEAGTLYAGYKILGSSHDQIDPSAFYALAIGSTSARKLLHDRLAKRGAHFTTLIHPSCVVSPSARLGEGSILCPFSFVGPEVVIGKQCILNIHSSAGHESKMGDYCILNPYAGLHGTALLEDEVHLGSKAYVQAGIKIGPRNKIAAGTIVSENLISD